MHKEFDEQFDELSQDNDGADSNFNEKEAIKSKTKKAPKSQSKSALKSSLKTGEKSKKKVKLDKEE